MLRGRGLQVAQRSKGEPIGADTDVYLADTLGEMGLWYRIAAVSFVGGSLVDVGGHNPFEPALLGSAILHGPHVRNFLDAYRRLAAARRGGAGALARPSSPRRSSRPWRPDRAAEMAAAAWEACSEGAEVTDAVLDGDRRLPRPQALMRAPALLGQPAGAPGAAARGCWRRSPGSGRGRRAGGWRAARRVGSASR